MNVSNGESLYIVVIKYWSVQLCGLLVWIELSAQILSNQYRLIIFGRKKIERFYFGNNSAYFQQVFGIIYTTLSKSYINKHSSMQTTIDNKELSFSWFSGIITHHLWGVTGPILETNYCNADCFVNKVEAKNWMTNLYVWWSSHSGYGLYETRQFRSSFGHGTIQSQVFLRIAVPSVFRFEQNTGPNNPYWDRTVPRTGFELERVHFNFFSNLILLHHQK